MFARSPIIQNRANASDARIQPVILPMLILLWGLMVVTLAVTV